MNRPDKVDLPDVPETIAALIEQLEGHPDAFAASSLGSWLALCYALAGRYGFCQVWLSKVEADNQLVPMTGTGVLPVDGCAGACQNDSARNPDEAGGYIISRDFGDKELYRLWRHHCPRCRGSKNAGAVFTGKLELDGHAFALSFHGPGRLRHPAPALLDELTAIVRHIQRSLAPQPQLPIEALKRALRNSPAPVFLADAERRIVWTNQALFELGHYGETDLLGRHVDELGTSSAQFFLGLEHAGGQLQPTFVLQALTPLLTRTGHVDAYLGVIQAQHADGDLMADAMIETDEYRAFLTRLPAVLARASRTGSQAVLLVLDLDRFQQVNDRYGNAAGDEVLAAVRDRLRQTLRGADLVARREGDQFVVLATEVMEVATPQMIARRILSCFAAPFSIQGAEVSVGATAGLATYPRDVRCPDSLLQCAETALYAAKLAGNGYQQYALLENDRACAV